MGGGRLRRGEQPSPAALGDPRCARRGYRALRRGRGGAPHTRVRGGHLRVGLPWPAGERRGYRRPRPVPGEHGRRRRPLAAPQGGAVTLSISHDDGTAFAVRDDDVELFRYTYVPDTPQFESPKPYLHPIRTRSGHLVSLFRPHDHVWHKGIAWSLPVVGDENFWGGPTYVRDQGYVQLPNDGSQTHLRVEKLGVDADGSARFVHGLEWITEAGARMFTE